MEEKTEVKKDRKTGRAKRNVTVMVVVLCICAAVYLNWSYNNQNGAESALADASLVGAKNNEETLTTQGGGDFTSEYFAQARLIKQQSRDEALSLLQVAASAESASQDTIDGAMNAIAAMANYSMQEAHIENLLLAKDFSECVVYMSGSGITVAVPSSEDGLTAEQVARITDAILSETTYNATQITIIPVKKPPATTESPVPQETPVEGAEQETILTDDIATQGGYIEDGVEIFE